MRRSVVRCRHDTARQTRRTTQMASDGPDADSPGRLGSVCVTLPRHRGRDDRLRLGDDLLQVLAPPEPLGVDLVEILGAGWAGRKPAVLGTDLDPADGL